MSGKLSNFINTIGTNVNQLVGTVFGGVNQTVQTALPVVQNASQNPMVQQALNSYAPGVGTAAGALFKPQDGSSAPKTGPGYTAPLNGFGKWYWFFMVWINRYQINYDTGMYIFEIKNNVATQNRFVSYLKIGSWIVTAIILFFVLRWLWRLTFGKTKHMKRRSRKATRSLRRRGR